MSKTTIDKEAVAEAYEEVRDDSTELSWFVMSYDASNIIVSARGTEYEDFLENFTNDQRLFGFVRMVCGDEMSKRAKFVFIQWNGRDVGSLKRAKMSVDKAVVKTVVKNFAVEVMAEERGDIEYETILDQARKAGGANYGTGQ